MGVCAKSYLGVSFFYVGQCVLWEWVVGEGGLYGLAPRSVLNEFTEDALTISADFFVPKWARPNGESVLATAGTACLLVGGVKVTPR